MRSSSPCGGGPTSRREHLVQEAAKRVGALRGDARVAGQAAAAVVARYAASGDLSEQGHRQAPELVHVCSRRRQCSAAERLRQEARAPTSVRVQVVQRGVAKRSVTARRLSLAWTAGVTGMRVFAAETLRIADTSVRLQLPTHGETRTAALACVHLLRHCGRVTRAPRGLRDSVAHLAAGAAQRHLCHQLRGRAAARAAQHAARRIVLQLLHLWHVHTSPPPPRARGAWHPAEAGLRLKAIAHGRPVAELDRDRQAGVRRSCQVARAGLVRLVAWQHAVRIHAAHLLRTQRRGADIGAWGVLALIAARGALQRYCPPCGVGVAELLRVWERPCATAAVAAASVLPLVAALSICRPPSGAWHEGIDRAKRKRARWREPCRVVGTGCGTHAHAHLHLDRRRSAASELWLAPQSRGRARSGHTLHDR
mmetsp:Transcript_14608/g.42735  ORF Transcript_14608/g.42735 Transcript_14608/m.42735 type:complete len:424 (-) Transcript_14608:1685-2956(-)